jgi:hypothetical protein
MVLFTGDKRNKVGCDERQSGYNLSKSLALQCVYELGFSIQLFIDYAFAEHHHLLKQENRSHHMHTRKRNDWVPQIIKKTISKPESPWL